MLRSGLVAAAEGVRAEIGRGREDLGLSADALDVWPLPTGQQKWTTTSDEHDFRRRFEYWSLH